MMMDMQTSRLIELEREDAARKALEDAANALELRGGNELYQRAWRRAADFLRTFDFKNLKTTTGEK